MGFEYCILINDTRRGSEFKCQNRASFRGALKRPKPEAHQAQRYKNNWIFVFSENNTAARKKNKCRATSLIN